MTIAETLLGLATAQTTGLTIAGRVALIAKTVAEKAAAVASRAYTAATWLAAAATNAAIWPITLIVVALAALAAGLIYAYKHSETFRRIVDAAFGAVKDAAQAALGWITSNWSRVTDALAAPIQRAWDIISAIFDKIRGAISAVSSAIKSIPTPKIPDLNPFSVSAAGATPVAGPYARGTAGTTTAGTSGGVVINVSGALDPDGVARQIVRLLDAHGTRVGHLSTLTPRVAL
jgi:phage-related minor tail protein